MTRCSPRGADRHWLLFADWCAATEQSPLPAHPATVLSFLTEMPARPATISRRLRAIDAAHRSAGLPAPGKAPEVDEIVGRHPTPPRLDPGVVARALEAIPVGGWPIGIVGRRDAAIVALVCSAGLTRAQVQALRAPTDLSLPLGSQTARWGQRDCEEPWALLASITRTERPGSCPACALSRWLRVAQRLDRSGWRAVRAELADYGEVPAGAERAHDCAQALPADGGVGKGALLFCAIDRRGAPETGYRLSTRSITAIVAGRLHAGDQVPAGDWQQAKTADVATRADRGHEWGAEDRRRAAARFAEVEAALDEMEAEAVAIMTRVRVAMGDEPGSDSRASE